MSKNFELENGRPFAAVAVVEGIETRDGDFNRIIEEGSVFVDQLPFPLLYSHDSDEVIGRVDRFVTLAEAEPELVDRAVLESPDILQFDPLQVWVAEGFFATTARAVEIQDLVGMRMLRGVSVGAGNASVAQDRDDAIVFNQFQVIELSVTSTQAIGPAMAWMSDREFVSIPEREAALAKFDGVLNDAPVRPPAEWFAKPEGHVDTVPVVDRGRLTVYLGKFGVPHRGVKDKLVFLPTDDDFSEYHLGNVRCEDGSRVRTGVIVMNSTHSDVRLSGEEVRARYEDTGTVVADVVMHYTDKGIVACGAIRPTISEEQIRELEAAPLSGEWRSNQLFAALAVNTPGFAVKADVEYETGFGIEQSLVKGFQGYFHDEDVIDMLEARAELKDKSASVDSQLAEMRLEILKLRLKSTHS